MPSELKTLNRVISAMERNPGNPGLNLAELNVVRRVLRRRQSELKRLAEMSTAA